MAWHWPGDKPLSKPMMLIYWCIYVSFGLNELIKCCETLHRWYWSFVTIVLADGPASTHWCWAFSRHNTDFIFHHVSVNVSCVDGTIGHNARWQSRCCRSAVRCPYNASVFSKILTQDISHLPLKTKYGMYYVESNSDLVTAVLYAISCSFALHCIINLTIADPV